jgi:hypothetical protein
MIVINQHPSQRALRLFGVVQSLALAILGCVVYWGFKAGPIAAVLWICAASLLIVYYSVPGCQRPIYVAFQYALYPLNAICSVLILAAIYYGLITVVGLCLRIGGYDPLRRKLDRAAKSYWIPHEPPKSKASYFRQF